jgi:hypothetical protein
MIASDTERISADFGELSRAVPEPASVGVIGMTAVALLGKRRRRG